MLINGSMVTLARDYREMNQADLALALSCSQSSIAKIEAGIKKDIDEGLLNDFSNALSFPKEFFQQDDELLGFGSSSFFYRKKATLAATDRRRVHSVVNLQRIAIKKLLPHIELEPHRSLPRWDIANYGDSAASAARALRSMWNLPDGPIKNLTTLVESAGVLVIPCDFGDAAVDATSLRLADMPPLVFMNRLVPGDRWRHTLAHELAHLILHAEPHEEMESEADTFAGEFLTPISEIRPQLSTLQRVQIRDLIPLKRYWKVSIQALIFRAFEAEVISETQKRSLFVRMSQLDIRKVEPERIELETPSNLKKMIGALSEALHFSKEEIASAVNWNINDLSRLLPVSDSQVRPLLRVV
jgi:Zn-dependent peptidase ImmA (M78 family)/transcriptional regulator with XRE-family HTH domain